MNENTQKIISLYNGKRSSAEISIIVGLTPRYVRKVAKKYNLERLHCGAQPGEENHQFVSGRRIDADGYVLITAPADHPYARKRTFRQGKLMFEHRLVMEKKLQRYLLPQETVDHIDGLTLHNHPDNLRLFQGNNEHLHCTLLNRPKLISKSGIRRIRAKYHLPEDSLPVDTYGLRRKHGDVRLLQILLAALQFGIDSPFLCGSEYWLRKAQIFDTSRSSLEHELVELCQRWEQLLAQ